ncbi:hypothetical protein STEG23_025618, partial [Scotinomys teguina]
GQYGAGAAAAPCWGGSEDVGSTLNLAGKHQIDPPVSYCHVFTVTSSSLAFSQSLAPLWPYEFPSAFYHKAPKYSSKVVMIESWFLLLEYKIFHDSCQEGNGPRLCLLCLRFRATAFQREELMKMKVKDLRDYLSLHDISTEMCREKEELVFLVLGQQPVISEADRTHAPTLSQDLPEHQAFLTQPHTSTVHTTSPGLPSSPAQATSVPLAQENQATGHVSQDHEEPVFLESTARVPAEDETQSIGSEDSFVPGRRASLSDLTHLEDIESLTVRQLKEILARNFVNYKGCCEKWELMERVTRLYKDQKGLQHLVSGDEDQNGGAVPSGLEENLCKICMDSPIDCVLLECGHMVTCTKCGKRMNECPICRQYVIRAVHVFRS